MPVENPDGCSDGPIDDIGDLAQPDMGEVPEFEFDEAELVAPALPAALTVAELTQTTINGTGVFDVLMRAANTHIAREFEKGSIRGPEYSTVYLGAMQSSLAAPIDFLLKSRREGLEYTLLAQQVLAAKVEVFKAKAQLIGILQQNQLYKAQVLLAQQQALNEAQQRRVLTATECKLRAEYDLAQAMILKTQSERALTDQRTATELAQTDGTGTAPDSVIGRQKSLYSAQAAGFSRDAEQKAAQILVQTWNTRRMSDVGTAPPASLTDTNIGRAVEKLLTGVNA